ncbi:MAG: DUF2383 domain-containing protein [Thermoanaerobaculia bacterium]
MNTTTEVKNADVDQLNSFLRGEISAVETYNQAIDKLGEEPALSTKLANCRSSHQQRVTLLKDEIKRLGGTPADGSGAWGSFAKLVEGGAKVFGTKATVAALEEGEDHGRDEYKSELEGLSADVRQFVEHHLLPEQLTTHSTLSALKHAL